MRQSRRGCFYQSEDKMYVWKIYNLKKNVVEQVDTGTATISLGSYSTINQASAYTVNSDGLFSLTSPTTVSTGSLTVGSYLVSLTPGGWGATPATTGSSLYKITSATSVTSYGNKTWTVGYEEYNVTPIVKGADTGNTVSSETVDYPIDGVQGDYWYVLIESPTQYIWDVYTYSKGLDESTATTGQVTQLKQSKMVAKSFTYSSSKFYLTDAVSTSHTALKAGDYIVSINGNPDTSTSGSTLYQITSILASTSYSGTTFSYKAYKNYGNLRGDTIVDRVGSDNVGDYPIDGVQGDYWYVLVYAGNPDTSKYVWDVSTVGSAQGHKVSSNSSTTLDIQGTPQLYIGTSYTYSNRKFVLSGTSRVYVTQINVGDYLVSLDSASTSASSMYEVVSVTRNLSSGTVKITYKRHSYSSMDAAGDYMISIGSETMDYPYEGKSGDYWYKMVKGQRTVYVWDKYSATSTDKYGAYEYSVGSADPDSEYRSMEAGSYAIGTGYTVAESTGYFSINGAGAGVTISTASDATSKLSGKWYREWYNYSKGRVYYGAQDALVLPDTIGTTTAWNPQRVAVSVPIRSYTQGSLSGTVESYTQSDYPTNNYSRGAWYVYSHSYAESFNNLE